MERTTVPLSNFFTLPFLPLQKPNCCFAGTDSMPLAQIRDARGAKKSIVAQPEVPVAEAVLRSLTLPGLAGSSYMLYSRLCWPVVG